MSGIFTFVEDLMWGAEKVAKEIEALHEKGQTELREKSALAWHYAAELLSTLLSVWNDHLGVMMAQTIISSSFEAVSIKNTAVLMKEAYEQKAYGQAIALGAMIPLQSINKFRAEILKYQTKAHNDQVNALRQEVERYK